MRKNAALSVRIPKALRDELEKVSVTEGRSLAEVCEALLGNGLEAYKEEGSKLIQQYLSSQKQKSPGQ